MVSEGLVILVGEESLGDRDIDTDLDIQLY